MTQHHHCIGIITPEECIAAANAGSRTRDPAGGIVSAWQDHSGARLTAHITDRTIDCTHPGFDGTIVVPARILDSFLDDECPHCRWMRVEVLDERGLILYQQLVLLEDMIWPTAHLQESASVGLNAAGFAESVTVFRDADAYWLKQPPETKVGPKWLIHSGTFSDKREPRRQQTSHVMVTGEVLHVRELLNSFTSIPFLRVLVDSYAYPMEVLIASATMPGGVQRGNVIQASCWVVARLLLATDRAQAMIARRGGGVAWGGASNEDFERLKLR